MKLSNEQGALQGLKSTQCIYPQWLFFSFENLDDLQVQTFAFLNAANINTAFKSVVVNYRSTGENMSVY